MKHAALWTVVTVAVVGVLLVPSSARAQCCPAGSKAAPAVKAWTAEAKTLMVKTPEKPKVRAKGCAKEAHASAVADLAEAVKAIDKALAAIQTGNSEVAVAQLQAAKKLVTVQHAAATRRIGPAKKLAYVNTRCPIMGSTIQAEKVTPKLIRSHEGRNVAFCCAGCIGPWEKLSNPAKAAKLAAASPKKKPVEPKAAAGACANTRCPIMGGPVKPGKGGSAVYDGKKVGFCCPGCITAWNRLTDSEKAAKLAKTKTPR